MNRLVLYRRIEVCCRVRLLDRSPHPSPLIINKFSTHATAGLSESSLTFSRSASGACANLAREGSEGINPPLQGAPALAGEYSLCEEEELAPARKSGAGGKGNSKYYIFGACTAVVLLAAASLIYANWDTINEWLSDSKPDLDGDFSDVTPTNSVVSTVTNTPKLDATAIDLAWDKSQAQNAARYRYWYHVRGFSLFPKSPPSITNVEQALHSHPSLAGVSPATPSSLLWSEPVHSSPSTAGVEEAEGILNPKPLSYSTCARPGCMVDSLEESINPSNPTTPTLLALPAPSYGVVDLGRLVEVGPTYHSANSSTTTSPCSSVAAQRLKQELRLILSHRE